MSDHHIVWEPEPTRRGTFSILITCLTTLGICIWSALHLSIPKRERSEVKNVMIKLLWMSIGLLIPELLILAALGQRLSAQEVRCKVNKLLDIQSRKRPWYKRLFRGTASKSSRLGEGKHVDLSEAELLTPDSDSDVEKSSVRTLSLDEVDSESEPEKKEDSSEVKIKRKHPWTLTHGFYAVMGGFAYEEQDSTGDTVRKVISGDGIRALAELKPELIPDISLQEIRNKAKSDGLAKALLIIQVGWFCINCLGRLAQHLPLTLLEISTAAHALCAIFVYALWWSKPLNVIEPTIIPHPGSGFDIRESSSIEFSTTEDVQANDVLTWTAVFIIVGALYGAPHFLAWNSDFTTHTEQLLWRISTCVVAGTPACLFIFGWILIIIDDLSAVNMNFFIGVVLIASPLAYFPANLYLIAASMRQLFHLSPEAFDLPVWSNYFPHFA